MDDRLFIHIATSLRCIAIGLAWALLLGVPLGFLLGRVRALDTALSPTLQFLRMISPLSWMPIAVMSLGIGDRAVDFLLAFAAIWPLVMSTAAGVAQIDQRWVQLGESLTATRSEMLWHVYMPGIAAHVLTGVRLAIGIVWIVLVPAEMLGVSSGLGYLILDTRDRLAYSELSAVILMIGALGAFAGLCGEIALPGLWRGPVAVRRGISPPLLTAMPGLSLAPRPFLLIINQCAGFDRDERCLKMVDQKVYEGPGTGRLISLTGIVDKQVG